MKRTFGSMQCKWVYEECNNIQKNLRNSSKWFDRYFSYRRAWEITSSDRGTSPCVGTVPTLPVVRAHYSGSASLPVACEALLLPHIRTWRMWALWRARVIT